MVMKACERRKGAGGVQKLQIGGLSFGPALKVFDTVARERWGKCDKGGQSYSG